MKMPKKEYLLEWVTRKPIPKNFTITDLDALMAKCGCQKRQGGRGSGIAYYNERTGRILQFYAPHPGNELKIYQIKKVITYLKDIGEI